MAPTRAQINAMLLGPKKDILPPDAQAHEVTTISMNYWDSLNYKINRRKIEAQEIQNNIDKENAIRQMSKNLWETWPYTVMSAELARHRKMKNRQARLDEIENEKKKIDKEEAEIQSFNRKTAIDKARTMQYYQNDRLKSFHSALMLTETLKEREIQREINKLKSAGRKEAEREEYMKRMEEYNKELEKEKEKLMKIRKTNIAFAQYNRDVHKRKLQYQADMKAAEDEEAKAVRKRIQKYDEEENNRKNNMKTMILEDKLQAISDHKKVEEANKILDEEEDDKIRMFAAGKRKMMKKVIAKQNQLFNEKQEFLEGAKTMIAENAQAVIARDKAFLEKAIKEGEAKFLAREEAKRLHNERVQNEINEHRIKTIKRHDDEKQQAKLDDIEEGRRKQEAYKYYLKMEDKKQKKIRERALSLVDYWDVQREIFKKNKDRVNTFKGKHCEDLIKLNKIEDEIYEKYTNEIIEHCRKGGRSVNPLLMETNRKPNSKLY